MIARDAALLNLSTLSFAVGAASQPCNVDGQMPPIITMLYLKLPMVNFLFCLFFYALVKPFRIISQEFHSSVVDVNS